MQMQFLKLQLECLLVPEVYPSNPYKFKLLSHKWEPWLKLQQRKATWRLKVPSPHRKPVIDLSVEWSECWLCDHTSKPRNNHNPNISPSTSCTRALSIKIDCNICREIHWW
ncbi:hypothetical protein M422DRAFT_31645 [Sphaerobolus stellatus SS14]|uniref:Uncharacterized protein n=1 Tax=Sphaerobolus stellatus (strain SS14) TaxID=990650 RepID=A0A0C9VSZ2_SPHS4|nr:hypothetical protein M422DRAFT_31645 [Sphaerobolus stellatus SS14]